MKYFHISKGVELTKKAIKERKEGTVKSLRTSKETFNKALMNGIDWNRIVTFAGLSGSGKSTLLEEIKQDFISLNKDQKFHILSFEFEMLIEDSLTRSVSSKLETTTKDLYSAFQPLDDATEAKADKVLDEIAEAPIYYVDTAGTVEEIAKTILDFSAKVSKDDGLVITLDHALLTKGKQTDLEKVIIDELMRKFVDLKKLFASKGLKIIFLVLSQLNRDIEKPERVSNQFLQFPNRNDIFASSAIYTCSDYVIITHRPAVVTGMRDFYGPPDKGYPKGRPVYSPSDSTKSMVYWHIIKERFGEQKILAFIEDFKNAKLLQA